MVIERQCLHRRKAVSSECLDKLDSFTVSLKCVCLAVVSFSLVLLNPVFFAV